MRRFESWPIKFRALVGVIGIAASSVIIPTAMSALSGSNGCGLASQPQFQDNSVHSVQDSYSQAFYPALTAVGTTEDVSAAGAALGPKVASAPGGITPRLVVAFGEGSRSTSIFYADKPMPSDSTMVDFLKLHGIAIARQPAFGMDANAVVKNVGGRAARLRIGPYDAAIVHADPVQTDQLRFYELHWSDGTWDFDVYGNVDAKALIGFARSIYC